MKFGRRFLEAREERQRKLDYARRRAIELLPICEEVTGVKLQVPLVVNATSLPKLLLGTQARVLTTFISRHLEERSFLGAAEYLAFLGTSVYASLKSFVIWDAFGYYNIATKSIGINMTEFSEGTARSDYTIAHELVHLLLAQLGLDKPINDHIVLIEGAATFYGELVVQSFEPSFDVTSTNSFGGVYERGYTFFRTLGDKGFDPVGIINCVSPLTSHSYECPNCGRTHTGQTLISIEQYVARLRALPIFASF